MKKKFQFIYISFVLISSQVDHPSSTLATTQSNHTEQLKQQPGIMTVSFAQANTTHIFTENIKIKLFILLLCVLNKYKTWIIRVLHKTVYRPAWQWLTEVNGFMYFITINLWWQSNSDRMVRRCYYFHLNCLFLVTQISQSFSQASIFRLVG